MKIYEKNKFMKKAVQKHSYMYNICITILG
jgi:hypothetical protein